MKKYLIGLLVGIFLGVSGTALAVVTKNFPDVPTNAFYFNELKDMVARDVIKGYQNGNFGPNDPVTRGQMVKILFNYDRSLSTYKDGQNDVGTLIDVLCKKITTSEADGDIHEEFSGLCLRRELAGADF